MKRKVLNLFSLIALLVISMKVWSIEIKTEEVGKVVYDQYVTLGGTVVPHKEITVNAQQAGQIDYIAGIEGDEFNSGAILVSIDDDALKARRSAAMAQWEQASYAYKNAISQYNRELWSPRTEKSMPGMALPGLMDQMFTKPFSNNMGYGDTYIDKRADVFDAQAKVQKASAQMRLIKSQIDEVDVHLSDTKSRAPFAGVIVKKLVEVGDTVQPGQDLLMFAKNNHLSIEINVPVSLVSGIKKGAVFRARFSRKMEIKVRVAQIFPVADPKQHTVIVKFDLPVGSGAAPGMYAEVSVLNYLSSGQTFVAVPKSSVIKRGSLPSIFVVNEKDKSVEMKIVRLGKEVSAEKVIVLSGIDNGEIIIVNPPASIVSGWILDKGKLTPPENSDNTE